MWRYIFLGIISIILVLLMILYPATKEIGTGIAILFLSILNLEKGFRIYTEGPLRKMIRKSTDNYFKSLSVGILSTALLNSSSLVSVLVISFLSAGLITLKAGIGIIFGANLGTTFTTWLIALFGLNFNISILAMPMIIFGVLFILQKNKNIKAGGYILLGLGFLFLGIYFLKTGFDSMHYDINLLGNRNLNFVTLLALTGVGILMTIILQSSAASLAVVLTALATSQISYMEALALAIGTNIGTTFTAIISSLASSSAGKKLAIGHLIFNLVTGLVAILLIHQIKDLVDILGSFFHIGPNEYTLKLALFHTSFNLLGIMLMTPWINQLLWLLQWLIKEKKEDVIQPKYLNKSVLEHTQSTIHALLKETEHMLDHTFEIIAHSLNTHRKDILLVSSVSTLLEKSRDTIPIDIDEAYLKKVKNLYSKIIEYASLAQMKNLTHEELESIVNIKQANRLLVEVIKDLIDFRINLNKYLDSDNQHIRETYDKFRKRILRIIKELFLNIIHYPYQMDASAKRGDYLNGFQLNIIKENIRLQREKIEHLDSEINQYITELISRELISSLMASSIINDSVFVTRICSNLLNVLELIYTEINEYDIYGN